jgi:hypothetical protein
MATTTFNSVSHYIGLQPEKVQMTPKRVRSAIRKAIPRAEEVP